MDNTLRPAGINEIPTPFYIVYEEKLRRNLATITRVAREADVKIIMAFKANALWKTFPVIREYVSASTASSLNEMRLSLKHLGNEVHTYCPVYTEDTFGEFLGGSTHITFNSLAQFRKFHPRMEAYNREHPEKRVSAGLRINPRCSVIETDIYNPCVAGSRFGEVSENLPEQLPEGLEGLHFHALCESSSHDLAKVLEAFETQYGKWLPQVKWLNMGGGHLMTRADYDTEHLISLLRDFHQRHPHLKLIMEPGSAFTWQTGDLVTTVLDVVSDSGISTAIIDASFACHMPDCLEMPYKPAIAEALPDDSPEGLPYRLGGNSCLSGDYTGNWRFAKPLAEGQRLTLLDMNHYTTVKTTMFNGLQHPDIWWQPADGAPQLLRRYTFDDYESRMD